MLCISYSKIKAKHRTILNENTLSLPVGKGVLLSGEHSVISSLFAHILYQNCTFSLDEEVVERALFNHNIALVSSEGVLPLTKKVKDIFLDAGISREQCQNALREIALDDICNKRMYRLSKEKRILLSLQLACVNNPALLLLEGDWQKLSLPCLAQITKLLQKHLANARFLLVAQGASQLIQCDTQYEIVGQTLVSKQSSVTNFLEEKGIVEAKQNGKQKRLYFKKAPSLLGVIGHSLFCILAILFVCATLMATLAMFASIQHISGIVQIIKERGEYRIELANCSFVMNENEYCSGTKFTPQQKTLLQGIEQIDQLYPVHKSTFVQLQGMIPKKAKLFRNGEEVLIDEEERSPFYTTIYSYDIAMTQLEQTEKGQRGIYISRAIKDQYKDMFMDVEEKKMSIEVLVNVPVYNMSTNTQAYAQFNNGDTTMSSEFHISETLPITLPISGVIEGAEESWYIEDTIFFAMQEEAKLQNNAESIAIPSDPDAVMSDYEAFQYNMNVTTYEDLVSVEAYIREQDKTIQVRSDILNQEHYIQELQDQQAQMRRFLLPIISVLGVLLLVLLTLSYKFQKDAYIFAFQRQDIDRKWKRKQMGKSLFVSAVVMMLTISTIYLFSSVSLHVFVLNALSNQATIANIDLYNSMIYQLVTGVFQLAPTFLNFNGIAVVLVIAIVIGILRYLPTWYFYFKARKLL